MQELSYKIKVRLIIVSSVIYVLSGLIFIRLFYLQMVRGDDYLRQSLQNKSQIIKTQAYRSVILDQTQTNKLAYNRKSICIVVIPANLPTDSNECEQVFSNTSLLIEVPVIEIKKLIQEQAFDKYTPVVLKYDIDMKTLVNFSEHLEKYDGLLWQNRPRRIYPLGKKASLMLGYTGIISKDELNKLKNNTEYHSGSMIGKMGVERIYDETIRGKEGTLERVVDAMGNVLGQNVTKESTPGDSLVLAIDYRLQEMAYDLMEDNSGAVIISKPSTGEILTLVSKPSFDPELFTERFSEIEYHSVVNDPNKPFLNRAIQGTYPPSSIFKLVTTSAGLDAGWNPARTEYCTGSMQIGNRVFKCWGTHHSQDLVGGIAQSCDVYFYNLGIFVGRDKIIKFAKDYGLTSKSQLDIPGELVGLVPEMAWFTKRYSRPWSQGDTANISIGQGDLLATPIALNLLTAAIVNNGIIYKPYLLKKIISMYDKKALWERKPEILRKVNLSPEYFELIRKGMYGVCTYGTAGWIKYTTDVPIAGKTGTGQAGGNKEDHALFTAYAPYGDPNSDNIIAVTVVVEHGKSGSGMAAPIAIKLIDYYFHNIKKIHFAPQTE